jgi:hypothetical protein
VTVNEHCDVRALASLAVHEIIVLPKLASAPVARKL